MKQAPLTLRRWTRAEYDRIVDLGTLDREPVELIGGHLVVAEPHGSYHASTLGAAGDALRAALPPGWLVRVQLPVALDDESEPEPDLAVVPGEWAEYRAAHPSRPALVGRVEQDRLLDLVADSTDRIERVQRSLEHDRGARPTHGAESSGLHRVDILAVEHDLALDLRLSRQQAEHGGGDRRLAASRLARQPHRLTGVDDEVDAAHGRDVPALGAIGDVQVAKFEHAHEP